MSDYNPFGKAVRDLATADLAILRTAHEGWYIEYKSKVPNASSIAKSISAFANTYGGWLFYGIQELSKENPVAGSFPGIPRTEMDAALQCIRHAAAASVNPDPHFAINVVWGPDDETGIERDCGVICLHVAKGHAAPYVHKTGLIYRRVGDGSEPKAETDRFILDQLWRRGEDIRKQYRRWISDDLELSKAEKQTPYLRLFLSPDLWRDQNVWAELTTSRVREIFSGEIRDGDTLSATPFDTVYRTSSGFVGRQVKANDPHWMSASWFLRENLTSEVVIPLHTITGHVDHLPFSLEGYEHAHQFAGALRDHGHQSPTIIDLNLVFSSLIGVFHTQTLLDQEAGRKGPVYFKAQLLNVWRLCPFLDVPDVVAHQAQFGVPLCMWDKVLAPAGKDPETFIVVPDCADAESPATRKMMQAIIAFQPIADALGIETGWDAEPDADGSRPLIHSQLIAASLRALTAQELRTAKHRDD